MYEATEISTNLIPENVVNLDICKCYLSILDDNV